MTIEEMASMGGKARSAKLSPERRKEIATNAGNATKAKYGVDYFKNIRNGKKFKLEENTIRP